MNTNLLLTANSYIDICDEYEYEFIKQLFKEHVEYLEEKKIDFVLTTRPTIGDWWITRVDGLTEENFIEKVFNPGIYDISISTIGEFKNTTNKNNFLIYSHDVPTGSEREIRYFTAKQAYNFLRNTVKQQLGEKFNRKNFLNEVAYELYGEGYDYTMFSVEDFVKDIQAIADDEYFKNIEYRTIEFYK